eukprot:EG_transcript_1773
MQATHDNGSGNQAYVLCHKAHEGDLAALRQLHAEGLDLGVADYDGRTALHLAAAGGHLAVVRFLVEEAGCALQKDRFGMLPTHDAERSGHAELTEYLRTLEGHPDTPKKPVEAKPGHAAWELCQYAVEGNVEALRRVHLSGGDLGVADYDGRTPLHLAAAGGNLEAVQFLVEEAGCRLRRDRFGSLPTDDAERSGHSELVRYLEKLENPNDGTARERAKPPSRSPRSVVQSLMPESYLSRAVHNPGLFRVHITAINSFFGPDHEDTTMVVQHRFSNGFVVSVLDTQNCSGSLLHTLRNTLPPSDRMMHTMNIYTSFDDTLSLSVFHYCHDYHRLEKPTEADIEPIIKFSEEVQLGVHLPAFHPQRDYSQDHLTMWVSRCTAFHIRSTSAKVIYRMYTHDKAVTSSGQPVVEWEEDEDELRRDLPPPDADPALRQRKQQALQGAFWVNGLVHAVPVLKVVEACCRAFLAAKLSIERAHASVNWGEAKSPTVLMQFLVAPTVDSRGPGTDTRAQAERTVAAISEVLAAESPATYNPPSIRSGRVDSSDEELSGNDDSLVDTAEAAPAPASPPPQSGVLGGFLLKQRQSGVLRLWQKRHFELVGTILTYSNPKEPHLFKSFDLQSFTLGLCDSRKFAFSLTENGGGKKVLRLACTSEPERRQWWAAITAAQKEPEGRSRSPSRVISPLRERKKDSPLREKEKDKDRDKAQDKDAEWEAEGELMERYQRICGLGRGTSGKVWKVRDRETGEVLAMKVMDKSYIVRQQLAKSVLAEKGILEGLRHPFVIRLHCAFQTNSKLCLVLDYLPGGTLQHLLDKWCHVPEAVARFYATEMVLAVGYLHSRNIIHRDLKPTNVLLTADGHAVVTDFGIATSSAEAQTFCGTLHYIAPEVLSRRVYTKAVDWWCMGVLLYQMLAGALPFLSNTGMTGSTVYRNILNEDPNFQTSALSPAAASLLKGLMEKDPDKRTSYERVMKHPFFSGVDWDAALKLKLPPPLLPDV